jgi:hypothetical protein
VQILKGLRETLEEASAAPLPAGASSSTAESIKEGLVQVGVRLMPPPPLLVLLLLLLLQMHQVLVVQRGTALPR